MDIDKAIEKQLQNLQTRTGKSLAELTAIIRASGLVKHGELREMLKRDLGMGHGDANTLVLHVLKGDGTTAPAGTDEVLDGIYSGAKTALRPIHEALMARITALGPFEIAPKKGYLSLRRKKQFAMIGPATNSRIEVSLNAKGLEATERLIALPPGGMCPFKVKVSSLEEVDAELMSWIAKAYTEAG